MRVIIISAILGIVGILTLEFALILKNQDILSVGFIITLITGICIGNCIPAVRKMFGTEN
jgi:hypothetical protein